MTKIVQHDILQIIMEEKEVTKSNIAKKMNVSKTAIGKVVNKMIDLGVLEEQEKVLLLSPGRPGKKIDLSKSFGGVLGIHFEYDHVKVCISNLKGEFLENVKVQIEGLYEREIFKKLFYVLDELYLKYKPMIISVGIGGIVNPQEGISILSVYYNWENINVKKILESRYKTRVIIDNGANLIAVYEKTEGKAKGIRNFVTLNIDNGIGVGIFIDGNLYRGNFYEAGEIGHTPYDYSKEALLCSCGNKGCLETKLANWRIEERVFKEKKENISFEEMINKANNNDKYYVEIFYEISRVISHSLLWIKYLLNPEVVVIVGKINKCDTFFWRELSRVTANNTLNRNKMIKIIKSDYDENSILKGAIFSGINFIKK